jgi:hypothetical protein
VKQVIRTRGRLVQRLLEACRTAGWGVFMVAAAITFAAALGGLGGCGPGLGGTGTGAEQDAITAYGARSAPVCESDFADLIGCTPPGTGAAPLPATDVRFFAEATPASRTLLELDGQDAALRLRCQDLSFVGSWGQAGNEAPRFFGNIVEGSRVTLATLVVQRSGSGAASRLTLTLVDASGRIRFGPQAVEPVAGATTAAPCN